MKTIPVVLLPDCIPDSKLQNLMESSYGSDGWPEDGYAFLIHRDSVIEYLEDIPGCEAFLKEIKKLASEIIVVCPDIVEYKGF